MSTPYIILYVHFMCERKLVHECCFIGSALLLKRHFFSIRRSTKKCSSGMKRLTRWRNGNDFPSTYISATKFAINQTKLSSLSIKTIIYILSLVFGSIVCYADTMKVTLHAIYFRCKMWDVSRIFITASISCYTIHVYYLNSKIWKYVRNFVLSLGI